MLHYYDRYCTTGISTFNSQSSNPHLTSVAIYTLHKSDKSVFKLTLPLHFDNASDNHVSIFSADRGILVIWLI